MSTLKRYHPTHPTELWAEGQVHVEICEEDSIYLAVEVEQVFKPLLQELRGRLDCYDEYGRLVKPEVELRDAIDGLLARLEGK